MGLIHAHIARPAPSPAEVRADVPEVIAQIILRLLAKNPEDRYQTTVGLEADLRRCLEQLGPGGRIPTFPLGQGDVSGRLMLAQALYGREAELTQLSAAFDRVSAGGRELVVVSGAPGIGKSALVLELGRAIAEREGYLISGKFGQYKRGRPFGPLLDAFDGLAQQFLTLPEPELEVWRREVLTAIGANAGLITEALPGFARILGPQPSPPTLDQTDAQNRFQFVFHAFVKVFCRPGAPLVMLVDDLQWADHATVGLIEALLRDDDTRHLLLLASLRDTEVSLASPFPRALRRLEEAGVPIDRIELAPLGVEPVAQLIADTLSCDLSRAATLAAIVHEKTLGNPFFVNQFLTHLHDVDVLHFNRTTAAWTWDEPRLRALDITDNVVEFMTQRLLDLPAACQRALQLAACVGSRFALTTLLALGGEASASGLDDAVVAGLIVPLAVPAEATTDDGADASVHLRYRFRHDRVHQAAYSLTPPDERAQVHLRIGRQLLAAAQPDHVEARIFDIIEQLQEGAALITDPTERDELVRLHAIAARRALDSLAFASALEHVDHGLALIGDAWSTRYDLTLELHQIGAAAAVMVGATDRMQPLCDAILLHGRGPHDKLPAWSILINHHFSQSDQVVRALDLALDALASLGLRMPRRPSELHTAWYLLRTKWALGRRTAASLATLPELTDRNVQAILRLLVQTDGVAYMANPNSFATTVMAGVLLSLRHGHSSASGWAYNLYGAILAAGLGDIVGGKEIATFGFDLARARGDQWMQNRIAGPYYITVAHWSMPMHETQAALQECIDQSMALGSYNPAGASLMYLQFYRLFSGTPLGTIVGEQLDAMRFAKAISQGIAVDFTSICHQLASDLLLDTSDPIRADLAAAELQRFAAAGNKNGVFMVHFARALHALIAGDLDAALAHSDLANPDERSAAGTILGQEYPFIRGLILTRCAQSSPRRSAMLREARARRKTLRGWQVHCPHNLEHKADLVDAGIARLEGRDAAAAALYDRAHGLALERGFLHEAALASELAAHHHAGMGAHSSAAAWLADARYEYGRWGAARALRRLARPALEVQPARPALAHLEAPRATMDQDDTSVLDVATILRSTDAVLREMDLDRLLETVMRAAVENAGAQRGALLVASDAGLTLEASHPPRGDAPAPVCQAVVDYVRRSRGHLVLDDASAVGHFTADDYIRREGVRSVLCIPLVNQSELIAILYLENNLARAVFTPDRIELLTLLAAQAAITIRNARLYTEQVRLTEAYSRFVPTEFLRQLGRDSIVQVALGDQVEMDMAVLFADIRSFSTLSERLTPPQTFAFLNEFLSCISPVIRLHHGFIDKYIGDAIMALFPRSATDAALAAAALHAELEAFNDRRAQNGEEPIRIGVGVHYGRLMLGTIGEPERMEGTVISDAVNIAARLQELTKTYGARVLLSDRVCAALPKDSAWDLSYLGQVPIRGKRDRVGVYELLSAEPPDVRARKRDGRRGLDAAITALEAGRADEAAAALRALAAQSPGDRALMALLARSTSVEQVSR
jgi:predicted ATPase/class 3 adenylate cyclase